MNNMTSNMTDAQDAAMMDALNQELFERYVHKPSFYSHKTCFNVRLAMFSDCVLSAV